MIEQAYPYLILIGLTIGAVMATLWLHARKASRINLALIRLNEQSGCDLPAFLAGCWPLLEKSDLLGMRWQLDWFGVHSEHSVGADLDGRRCTERRIEVGEMAITLRICQREGRGERGYFEATLIETLVLLLRTDMLIKASATDATLNQLSRLNLFLQHDMKNIAQFIQLMSDQLQAVAPGKEQRVLDYLRQATPLIRHRADRIVRTLTVGAMADDSNRVVALAPYLAEACGVYALAHQIEGEASVESRGSALDTVFDNLLKNYFDIGNREGQPTLCLHINIAEKNGRVQVSLQAPGGPAAPAPERLFEPFWSSDPSGLGIGLYHARQTAELQGGRLDVRQASGAPLCFIVEWPGLAQPA